MVNSLQKGNRGEREIVKILSYLTGVPWKRVPRSGALFTTHGSTEFQGDVYCKTEPYDRYVIEVKNTSHTVSLKEFFLQSGTLNKWIDQLTRECNGRPGFLFFKQNGIWFWFQGNSCKEGNHSLSMKLRRVSHTKRNFGMIDKDLIE